MRPHRPHLSFLTLAVLGAACGANGGVPKPDNLLFLCVDTLRADQLGAFGAQPSITPRIDSLATSGVVFENAISHASWTLPSFASILTSQYTSTHGCWTFDTPLSSAFTTLPEIFSAAGFRTHGIASHIFFNEQFGLQQGFDDFDDELAHKAGEEGWTKVTSPLITNKAVRWIEERAAEQGGAPWLLWTHYFDPHIPYVDHERLENEGGPRGPTTKSEFDRYRSEIAHTDRHLERLLETLETTGFAERTAIVFVSDHGESFFEHPGVFRHARSLFREELRVPLILKVPGLEPRRVAQSVRTVDLLPTLLEVFRIELESPLAMEGVSLVPTLMGEAQSALPALAEIRLHDDTHHVRSFIRGSWKLIEGRTGTFHLYNVEADEKERMDLAGAYPDRMQELRAEMEAMITKAAARGQAYERGVLEHSAKDLEDLKTLGYIGEEGEEEEE